MNSHKAVISLIRIVIIVALVVSLSWAGYSIIVYVSNEIEEAHAENSSIQAKLDEYKKKETELGYIERTVKERYTFLSDHEIHYYSVIFQDYSHTYNIPWEALAALIRVESNFDPSLKSSAGAKGMTQVMEYTGKSVAKKLGIKYEEGKTLWNDLLNMVIGFTYFCDAYKEIRDKGGSEDDAIRHAIGIYIGGPNYANKKQKNYRVYVKEYRITVYQEYKTLKWMFKGVCAELDSSHVN